MAHADPRLDFDFKAARTATQCVDEVLDARRARDAGAQRLGEEERTRLRDEVAQSIVANEMATNDAHINAYAARNARLLERKKNRIRYING